MAGDTQFIFLVVQWGSEYLKFSEEAKLPSELRICPHCGAAVSGDTQRCPRCDGLLTDIADVKTIIGAEEDFQARTLLEDSPEEPILPSTESAYEPMATVIDSQPAYQAADELERVLNEQPIEFKTDQPLPSIYQAQTIVGMEDEARPVPNEDLQNREEDHPKAIEEIGEEVKEDDREPVGIVDSTPNEFQPPVVPSPSGMKTIVDDSPPVGFSEARTEAFQQLPSPATTPARGSALVTIPAETASHPMDRQTVPNAYLPQYAPPVPQPMPIPRAPYTPPPASAVTMASAPSMAYAQPAPPRSMPMQQGWGAPQPAGPSDYWLRQRTQTYLNGGYKLKGEGPGKIMLAYGKSLGLIWWVVAVTSVIGALWYFLILLFSGFRKDKVTIFLEPDGYVFEDGSGAAHVRIRRWRSARRWGVIGIILAVVSLLMFLMLVVAAYVIGNQYEAELEKAYPEITFFESTASEAAISQADVEMVRLIVLVLGILFVLAAIGTLGGAAVAVVSYLQAAAYHVDVPPLPGFW